MRVLLDSSVLVSAFLVPENTAGMLVRAGLDDHFEICVSQTSLAEVARSLRHKHRLRRRYRYTDMEITSFVEDMGAAVTVVSQLPAIPPVCRDPNDDHVLAAALAASADYVVTGDGDLLDLGAYQGIGIVGVRTFMQKL